MKKAFLWICIIVTVHRFEADGKAVAPYERFWGLMHVSPPYYGEPLTCGYLDLETKYQQSCHKNYLKDIFPNSYDGKVYSGQDVLEKISNACSNYDSYKKCANCTAHRDCPEQRNLLTELLLKKWSIFCDKDQVSDWLQTILQNGYRTNETCWQTAFMLFGSCFGRTQPDSDPFTALHNMTLEEGYEHYATIGSEVSRCTVGEFLGLADYWDECGSTWQDELLTLWLQMSTNNCIGCNVDQKQMLQDIRC